MTTRLDICNRAISRVGGTRMTAFRGEFPEANFCIENYDAERLELLELAPWSFATRRYVPAYEAEPPAFGYNRSFLLDPEIIAPHVVSDNPDLRVNNPLDWVNEDRHILCNADVIYVKATYNQDDPVRFTPGFTKALVCSMAAHMALPVARSRQLYDALIQEYVRELEKAMAKDGQGAGRHLEMRSSQLVRARRQGTRVGAFV